LSHLPGPEGASRRASWTIGTSPFSSDDLAEWAQPSPHARLILICERVQLDLPPGDDYASPHARLLLFRDQLSPDEDQQN
jgi:hypothetical protein